MLQLFKMYWRIFVKHPRNSKHSSGREIIQWEDLIDMCGQLICKKRYPVFTSSRLFFLELCISENPFFIIVELVGMKWVELNLLKDVFFSIDSSGFAPSRVLLQNIYSDRVSVQLYYRINPKLLVCFTYKRDFSCKTFLKRCPKQEKKIIIRHCRFSFST